MPKYTPGIRFGGAMWSVSTFMIYGPLLRDPEVYLKGKMYISCNKILKLGLKTEFRLKTRIFMKHSFTFINLPLAF